MRVVPHGPRRGDPPRLKRAGRAARVPSHVMFLFFSNRMGCLGSLVVSAAITLVLLLVLGVLD